MLALMTEKVETKNSSKTENNEHLLGIDIEKDIAKTWISGQNCCTLIISRKLAERYGLTEPSHVVLEGTERGILIRKLEV